LFNVTDLPIENVPRELATFVREVLDNGGKIHAEPYVEPAHSSSPWPEQHKVVSPILPCNYIIRPLPSTYDKTRSSVCLHFVSKTKAGSASRPISHKNDTHDCVF